MAVYGMNGDGQPYYDPITQDLYLYPESGTGDPIAWNPSCVAFKYREQLETRKAKARAFTTQSMNYPFPVNGSIDQKANHFNNRSPPAIWFNETRGLWSTHYYSAYLTRNPNYNLPVSGTDHITQFLNLNNTIVTLPYSDILHPYVAWSDYCVVEYSGNLLQGKKFPKLGSLNSLSEDMFDSLMYIDSQDKVIMIPPTSLTLNIVSGSINASFTDNRVLSVYLHDSGSQLFGIKNDILFFLGHIETAASITIKFVNLLFFSNFSTWNLNDKKSFIRYPNYNEINIIESEFIGATKNPAKQQTLNECLIPINEILKNIKEKIEEI